MQRRGVRSVPTTVFLVATVLFLIGLFTGCCDHCFSEGPAVPELPPYYDGNVYYPIQLGNYWYFREVGPEYPYMMTRTLYDTVAAEDVEFTWMSERLLRYDGLNLSQTLELYDMSTDTLFVAEYSYAPGESLMVDRRAMERLLNPLRPGDSLAWLPRGVIPNFGYYFWHIGSVDTNITTSDTTWEGCLETYLTFVSSTNNSRHLLRQAYFAPDVGPVLINDYPFEVSPGDLGDTMTVWELYDWVAEPVLD